MRSIREDLAATSLARRFLPDNPAFCCTQRGEPVWVRVDVKSLPVFLYTGFALLDYVLPVTLLSKAELLINLFTNSTDKSEANRLLTSLSILQDDPYSFLLHTLVLLIL